MEHGEYIDDFFALGSNQAKLTAALEAVVAACEATGTPAKGSKISCPGTEETTRILGVMVGRDGTIGPAVDKLVEVVRVTRVFVLYRGWNRTMLERILGSWAWLLLLRRPMFSILGAVYKALEAKGETLTPTYKMRCELNLLVQLAPLIGADLRRPFNRLCIATDASLRGGGVTYTDIEVKECLEMGEGEEVVRDFAQRS